MHSRAGPNTFPSPHSRRVLIIPEWTLKSYAEITSNDWPLILFLPYKSKSTMRAGIYVLLGLVASTQAFFAPQAVRLVGAPVASCRSSRYVRIRSGQVVFITTIGKYLPLTISCPFTPPKTHGSDDGGRGGGRDERR